MTIWRKGGKFASPGIFGATPYGRDGRPLAGAAAKAARKAARPIRRRQLRETKRSLEEIAAREIRADDTLAPKHISREYRARSGFWRFIQPIDDAAQTRPIEVVALLDFDRAKVEKTTPLKGLGPEVRTVTIPVKLGFYTANRARQITLAEATSFATLEHPSWGFPTGWQGVFAMRSVRERRDGMRRLRGKSKDL